MSFLLRPIPRRAQPPSWGPASRDSLLALAELDGLSKEDASKIGEAFDVIQDKKSSAAPREEMRGFWLKEARIPPFPASLEPSVSTRLKGSPEIYQHGPSRYHGAPCPGHDLRG